MASINNLNEKLFEAKKTKNKLKKINVFFVRHNNVSACRNYLIVYGTSRNILFRLSLKTNL